MTNPVVETQAVVSSADRRILSLLDGYVALAGGNLTLLGPDLYQLNVPKGDEARFSGRSVVRVALTVDALELDDRAEMAIVGSSFVNELIEAIRARGSRRLAGWVVPRAANADAAPRLPIPIRNGSGDEARASLVRHRVGRLTARVAIRAGTELRERLANSSLYDLCSGIALPADVAAACDIPAPPEAVSDHWRSTESAPTQKIPALIDRMLTDLESALGPEIDEMARNSERALSEELDRIGRYYTAMVDDLRASSDLASWKAIRAEHDRRETEERDRHAVRAVVHPVQLTEWEMLVQRATWNLTTPSRHHATFTAQRPLAGKSVWTFSCSTCGTLSPSGLHVCFHHHMACDACASTCSVCHEHYCRDHGILGCHIDGKPSCDEHARTCTVCRRAHCSTHEGTCFDGGHPACASCLGSCAICGQVVCDAHASTSLPDAARGSRRFCHSCAQKCEGGSGEVVGPDEVMDCASCERVVCERHQSRCAVDNRVHCSRHLRRTDRSRRLVCENDRAACSCEPNAVFARDEVAACHTCGRVNCDQHLANCVVDEQQHCIAHVARVADKPGAFACDAHRSTCHVDGRQYTRDGTRSCPCCGRLACAQHTRECQQCRRIICVQDFALAGPKTCATCAKLAADADPVDEIIAAALELRGADAPMPKRWKVARDARHLIVELDLGWTRRLLLAVPHGESRAERAVAHSALGARVLR